MLYEGSAPNVYFLGNCGWVPVRSIRIASAFGTMTAEKEGAYSIASYMANHGVRIDTLVAGSWLNMERLVFAISSKMVSVDRAWYVTLWPVCHSTHQLACGRTQAVLSVYCFIMTGHDPSSTTATLAIHYGSHPFPKTNIETGQLGSPPTMARSRTLEPQWWFSAHGPTLGAVSNVPQAPTAEGTNPGEIVIDDSEDMADAATTGATQVLPDPPPPANPDG